MIIEVDEISSGIAANYVLNMTNPLSGGTPTDSFTTVSLGSGNVVTFSGSVAENGGGTISSVKVYNGSTLITPTPATINGTTWTLQVALPSGTYNQLNVVATDSSNNTKTANSPISLVATASGVNAATFVNGSTGTLNLTGTNPATPGGQTLSINGFVSGDVVDFTNLPGLTTSVGSLTDSSKGPSELDVYNATQPIAKLLLTAGGTSVANEIKPGSDNNSGTNLVVDPPVADNPPPGYTINWSTILGNEGNDVFVPYTLRGPRAGHSGITIASGVDLNNLGIVPADFAAALHLSSQQIQANANLKFLSGEIGAIPSTTTPKSKINTSAINDLITKAAAIVTAGKQPGQTQQLSATTISITPAQATELDNFAEQRTVTKMTNAWSVPSVAISQLDTSVQTALADVFYNGAVGTAGVLAAVEAAAQSTAAPNTPAWQTVWGAVVHALNLIPDTSPRFTNDAKNIQSALNLPVQAPPTPAPISPESNSANLVSLAETSNSPYMIDPSGSTTYVLTANSGSPAFSSLQLPTEDDAGETFSVSFRTGSTWSTPQIAQPLDTLSVPTGTSSVKVTVLDPNGGASGIFGFFVTFATSGTFSGTVIDVSLSPATSDFYGVGTSDVLFRNDTSGAWGWSDIQNNETWHDLGGSSTAYLAVGVGDLNGDGADDVLWRNGTSGAWGWSDVKNSLAWHDLGGSSTAYHVVGVGDLNGDGSADVLWRNDTSGTWGWSDVQNNLAWHDLGGSSTAYNVVGVGDFNGDGSADVLWRNDTSGAWGWSDVQNNLAWHDLGGSSTAYNVVGVGDFNGDGYSDVLWRNNTTGAWGWSDVHNNLAWHDLGSSLTSWNIVGVGDYNSDGASDALWRNNATGAWAWSDVHNSNAWHDLGGSLTTYKVVS
jgi:hypothetical protein